ncbi:hypothetical protein N9P07_02360 [Alphaproteobacteria bacterium]|nr:hypothetical protein [Alphaproteobacteria bacterium]
MDDHWLNKSDHNTITYTSPNFSNFVLGISYDDAGTESNAELLRLVSAIQQQLVVLVLI